MDPVGARYLGEGGILQHRPVVADEGGQVLGIHAEVAYQCVALLRANGMELERDAVARERVTQGVGARLPSLTHDAVDHVAGAVRPSPRA